MGVFWRQSQPGPDGTPTAGLSAAPETSADGDDLVSTDSVLKKSSNIQSIHNTHKKHDVSV